MQVGHVDCISWSPSTPPVKPHDYRQCVQITFQRLDPGVPLPTRAHPGDAGNDRLFGDAGFDLVKLNETEEGGPLMEALLQQRRTIPAVRVYGDPKHADKIKKRFAELFPAHERQKHRDDEYDFSEY